MLQIKKNRKVEWPIRVKWPVNGGRTETVEFTGYFHVPTRSQLNELSFKGSSRLSTEQETEAWNSQWKDRISNLICGWSGVEDEDGNAIEFSKENLSALLDINVISQAIEVALLEISSGAAAVKNSESGDAS